MKQFFLPLTEPVGAVWALMLVGTLWLLIRRQWRGAVWLGLPTVLLFGLGSTTLVERLVDTEERQWEDYAVLGRMTVGLRDYGTVGLQKADHGLRTTDFDSKAEGGNSKFQVSNQEISQVHGPQSAGEGTNGVGVPGSNAIAVQGTNSPMAQTSSTLPASALSPQPGSTEALKIQRSNGSMPPAAADVVVVLGGGSRMSALDPYGFAATDAFSRVLMGIELVRKGRAKDLVLGGSYPRPGKPQEPGMVTVDEWVRAWGLARCEVTDLGICLDTHDEAVAFKRMKRFKDWNSVILVTSALHMRRSVLLFQRMGIHVQPVAGDFEVCGVSQDLPFSIFPRQHRFRLWGLYSHEKIGMVVYRRKGWI